jgi:hypothetical protein
VLTEWLPELLLQKEPGNMQAQSLGGLIDQKVAQGSLLPILARCLR